jgi:hypothetical protein
MSTDWREQLWAQMEQKGRELGRPPTFTLYFRGDETKPVPVHVEKGELRVLVTREMVDQLKGLPAAGIPGRLRDDQVKRVHHSGAERIRLGLGRLIPLNAYATGLAMALYTNRPTVATNVFDTFCVTPSDLAPWLSSDLQQRVRLQQRPVPINRLAQILFDIKEERSRGRDKNLAPEDSDDVEEAEGQDGTDAEESAPPLTPDDPPSPAPAPRNLILFGPPGTGKTWRIREKIQAMAVPEENCIRVTFHPESSYYDFVGSHRPAVGYLRTTSTFRDANQKTSEWEPRTYYHFEPGALSLALRLAATQKEPVVLIIEEINRANCAAVFGDVFQLLDRDAEGWSEYPIQPVAEWAGWLQENAREICQNGRLRLPPNLYLYATMNTSDQSLYPMDSAFRRRWQMEYVGISHGRNNVRVPRYRGDRHGVRWPVLMSRLNERILQHTRVDDKQLGPWFLKGGPRGWVAEEEVVGKLLFYLWSEVFREPPRECFAEGLRTFEDVVEAWNDQRAVLVTELLEDDV